MGDGCTIAPTKNISRSNNNTVNIIAEKRANNADSAAHGSVYCYLSCVVNLSLDDVKLQISSRIIR